MRGGRSWGAGALLAVAARIVPADRRAEWRAEWEAELWELARRGGRSQLVFCLGAMRHALWLRRREWTVDLVVGDLRGAARSLARAPGFVAACALTLALGIGANASVFSLVNGLVLRAPAGIRSPEALLQIGRGDRPEDFDTWSYPYVRDLRAATASVFSGVAAWAEARAILGGGAEARAIAVQLVSGEYFEVLGVRAAAGRLIGVDDATTPGGSPVLVLSHTLWQTAFAGDPAIVGRDVVLDGRSWQVVGIAPSGFAGADAFRQRPAAWAPLTMQGALTGRPDDVLEQRGNSWLWMLARRAPGVQRARAEAAARAAHARIAGLHPEFTERGILFVEGVGARPAERAQVLQVGALLMATVLVVLAIACANLAGLVLARGAGRRGEMALRVVLGAGRGRLVRQLVLESILVSLLGGVLAVGVATLLGAVMPELLPVPVAVDFAPDRRVLAFTAALAIGAALAFGVAPAFTAARAEPMHVLRRSGVGRGGTAASDRMRRALVVVQVALAFVLLAGATLLLRSVRNAYATEPGFRTRDVLAVTIDIGRSLDLDADTRAALRTRVVESIAAVPGVTSAGSATVLPVAEPQPNRTPLPPGTLPSRRAGPPPPPVYVNVADGGYFRTLGLRTVAGRVFDDAIDTRVGVPAIVVNERFVARFFPDADPIGTTVRWAGEGPAPIIIGVVADAAIRSLGESPPAAMYMPASRSDAATWHILVAVTRDDAVTRAAIVASIARVEPRLPVLRTAPLATLVGGSLAQTRLAAATAGAAGALALLLAVVGLHGVIACTVAQRRREFGLRFALGARLGDVVGLVLRQAGMLAGAGIALGAALSLAALRVLDGLLFGVGAGDPATFGLIATLLTITTLAAGAIPALRAASSDPAHTLGAG